MQACFRVPVDIKPVIKIIYNKMFSTQATLFKTKDRARHLTKYGGGR